MFDKSKTYTKVKAIKKEIKKYIFFIYRLTIAWGFGFEFILNLLQNSLLFHLFSNYSVIYLEVFS